MTVSGTILLTYFATEIAEMSKEGEVYMVSLHFLHKCMVELKALMQGTWGQWVSGLSEEIPETTRDI